MWELPGAYRDCSAFLKLVFMKHFRPDAFNVLLDEEVARVFDTEETFSWDATGCEPTGQTRT